jgi:phage gpG-like protein
MTQSSPLQNLIRALDQRFDASAALAEAATTLAAQLRQVLATPPGGPHDHPWRQTGALQDSIEYQSNDTEALIGSTSETAAYQEHGTATMPPRPSFGPLAATEGATIARHIGHSVAEALSSAIRAV